MAGSKAKATSGKNCPSGRKKKGGKSPVEDPIKIIESQKSTIEELEAKINNQNNQIKKLEQQVTDLSDRKLSAEKKLIAVVTNLIAYSEMHSLKKVSSTLEEVQNKPAFKTRLEDLTNSLPEKKLQNISYDYLLSLLHEVVQLRNVKESSTMKTCIELENRVTNLGSDLLKLRDLAQVFEEGLKEIQNTYTLKDIHSKINGLRIKRRCIARELPNYVCCDDEKLEESTTTAEVKKVTQSNVVPGANVSPPKKLQKWREKIDNGLRDALTPLPTSLGLDLSPPPQKGRGATPLSLLQPALTELIIRELTLDKVGGSDWRTLSERIGFSKEQCNVWNMDHIFGLGPRPAKRLWNNWIQMDESTVRMLHRHLLSPAMRLHLLARRLSDFYEVD